MAIRSNSPYRPLPPRVAPTVQAGGGNSQTPVTYQTSSYYAPGTPGSMVPAGPLQSIGESISHLFGMFHRNPKPKPQPAQPA